MAEELPIDNIDLMAVFTNLLDNAIEANINLPQEKRYVRIDTKIESNYLVVKVENAKASDQNVMVEKNRTTKKDKKYHGLGLSFVQSICDNHDGSLKIEDEVESIRITALLRLQEEK